MSDGRWDDIHRRYLKRYEWVHRGANKNAGLYASEIGLCDRRVVYSLQATPKKGEVPLFLKRLFDVGIGMHEVIEERMRRFSEKNGLHFEAERKIDPSNSAIAEAWGIYSRCDGIFTDVATGERLLLEIKTLPGKEFGELGGKPAERDLDQVHVYMACLEIQECWLLYANMETGEETGGSPWLFRFDPERWARLQVKFARLRDAAVKGTLPPPEPGRSCDSCPYAWTCEPQR
jgi:hypothetical protein